MYYGRRPEASKSCIFSGWCYVMLSGIMRLSTSPRREALARGGQVIAAAAVLPFFAGVAGDVAAVPAAPFDDGGLLALWELRRTLSSKVDDPATPADESDRYFDEFSRLTDMIVAAPIATPVGIALKLRIAVEYEELDLDIKEQPRLVMPRAVVNALADAERLSGRRI